MKNGISKSLARYVFEAALWVMLCGKGAKAQHTDSSQMRQWIAALSAPNMHGRGYVAAGMDSAASYIGSQLLQLGLPFVFQPFTMPVNTFPDTVAFSINKQWLVPGRDFLVAANSKSYHGSFALKAQKSLTPQWQSPDGKVKVRVVPKLNWWVASSQQDVTEILINAATMPLNPRKANLQVNAMELSGFEAKNIMAMVPGSRRVDSMLLFTAHYDHLGMMGANTLFAGANDNASGVASLLALAAKVAAKPLPYSAVFIFFAAEEAGLLGSEYFVRHPLISLNHIRFLLNLDLMGNGEEGITVVNATEFPLEFELLQQLNKQPLLVPAIYSRGKAANSDHHYFTEMGIPSFFWYTMGSRKAYHDIDDVSETLTLPVANNLQTLIYQWANDVTTLPAKNK